MAFHLFSVALFAVPALALWEQCKYTFIICNDPVNKLEAGDRGGQGAQNVSMAGHVSIRIPGILNASQ